MTRPTSASTSTADTRHRVLLAVLLAGAAVFVAPWSAVRAETPPTTELTRPTDAEVQQFCQRFTRRDDGIEVQTDDLADVSGLVSSAVHDGVLWGVNDRGSDIGLVALGDDGDDLGTFTIDGVDHRDWEDVAVGPGPDPDRSYLYIADLGDNEGDRDDVSLIRVAEPIVAPNGNDGRLLGADVLRIERPDGPIDIEALTVDPETGDAVLVAKVSTGDPDIFTVAADGWDDDAAAVIEPAGSVTIDLPDDLEARPGTRVTGADLSPDGTIVVLRTYADVRAFLRPEGQTIAQALTGPSCIVVPAPELQGESIAFSADGTEIITVSETASAIEDGRLPAGTRPTMHLIDVAGEGGGTSVPGAPADEATSSRVSTPVLAAFGAGLALLALAALIGIVRTRRR